jgi:pilus assembly protein CpaF
MTLLSRATGSRLQGPDLEKVATYLIKNLRRVYQPEQVPIEQRTEILQKLFDEALSRSKLQLPATVRAQLFKDVCAEVAGYGPIQQFLDDPDVSEVMVNGSRRIYIERNGKLVRTNVTFRDDEHVLSVIDQIVRPIGRKIDVDTPSVDARLPDGSRVNAVIPPVAIDGPSITIRKFKAEKLGIEEIIKFGTLTRGMAQFLQACVVARLNIVISGGTGSGKTTLLNILSGFIPEDERIVTIEDAAELQLKQDHVVRLETRTKSPDGRSEITIRDLVRNSLRMRPDRVLVGECRGGETLDMLQAMNTGHDGSLTTLHANTPRDALARMETMALMAGLELPIRVIREQIASAIDLIVQVSRMKDGSRKVTYITEIVGMEGDTVVMTDIFKYEQTNTTPDGKAVGELKPTGIRPLFIQRLEAAGFRLGPEVFGAHLAEFVNLGRRREK